MENKLSKIIFDKIGVPNYQKYLDLSSVRHKLVSSNVANVATPGYEAKDIKFEEEFKRATSQNEHLAGVTTDSRHIPLGQHKDRPPEILEQRLAPDDLNSVDIDREMSNLAQNELRYTIAARLLQRKFDGLRTAITSK
jgi:flagellar basal-body rod protein FlgB